MIIIGQTLLIYLRRIYKNAHICSSPVQDVPSGRDTVNALELLLQPMTNSQDSILHDVEELDRQSAFLLDRCSNFIQLCHYGALQSEKLQLAIALVRSTNCELALIYNFKVHVLHCKQFKGIIHIHFCMLFCMQVGLDQQRVQEVESVEAVVSAFWLSTMP